MEKRCVIYIRVSDPSQIDNNSLETQEKVCRKFAETKGYEIIEPIFREEGQSSKEGHIRPEFRKLLSFCATKKNLIDAVIVYKYDRFSRSLEDALATISLLAKYNVEVLSVIEPLEQGPIGKALRNIMFILAELDNELKGARVKDNMQAAFRNGLWTFKCPIGYKRKYKTKEENKGIPPIQDLHLAPIVANMIKEASTGIYSKAQLARIMNLAGFGDFYRRKADHKTVKNILEKTFYYGLMYAPKWDEYQWGKHEPLIDQPTWELAHQRLILKKKRYRFQDDTLYPLKGTLKCELCEEFMTTSPSKGRNKMVYYYECKNKNCRKLRIDSKVAHEQFLNILSKVQPSKRVIKLFNHMVFSEWDKVINQTAETMDRLDKKIASLKEELNNVRKAKDDGIYTLDEAKEQANNIRKEITIFEVERSDIKIDHYNTEIVKDFTAHFLNNLKRLWESLDLIKRQELQKKIFANGLLCTKERNIQTTQLSPSFAFIEALASEDGKNVTPLGIEPKFAG
jgi:site-specific DNA recombinase